MPEIDHYRSGLPKEPTGSSSSMDFGKPGKNEGPRQKSGWMPVVNEHSPWLSIPGLIVSAIMAGIWYWIRHH
jgi:hypothetical protein